MWVCYGNTQPAHSKRDCENSTARSDFSWALGSCSEWYLRDGSNAHFNSEKVWKRSSAQSYPPTSTGSMFRTNTFRSSSLPTAHLHRRSRLRCLLYPTLSRTTPRISKARSYRRLIPFFAIPSFSQLFSIKYVEGLNLWIDAR